MTKKRSQLLARLDPGGRVARRTGTGKASARRRALLYSVLPVAALFAIGAGLVFQGSPDEMPQASRMDAPVADAVVAEKAPRPQPQEPQSAAVPETSASEEAAVAAAPVVEAPPEPLASNDPRFMPRPAGDEESAAPAGSAAAQTASDFAAPYARMPADMADADGSGTSLDETETAAIVTGSSAEPVEIAETDAEIAMLEEAAATTAATDPDAAFVVQEGPAGEDGGNAPDPATMPEMTEEAVVKEYVNFRTGPSNDAEVIRAVPGGTALKAQPLEGCVHFCAVDIAGEKGFIYKAFLNFSEEGDATAASEPSEDADTAAALRL